MSFGPLFWIELRGIARRPRHLLIRFGVAVAVLLVVLVSWAANGRVEGQERTARFSRTICRDVILMEGLMVVAWTPAAVAGSMAGLRRRKSLPALLLTPLTSAEIVLGTLAARLIPVFTTLFVGLPILSLLTLLGGVEPSHVMALIAALMATSVFLGGVSILASTLATGPREAIVSAYA